MSLKVIHSHLYGDFFMSMNNLLKRTVVYALNDIHFQKTITLRVLFIFNEGLLFKEGA